MSFKKNGAEKARKLLLNDLRSYELVTIVYLAITSVIALVAASSIGTWKNIIAFHIFLTILIVGMSKLPKKLARRVELLRGWYLLAIYPFLFKELTHITKALFPYYLESALIASELFFIDLHLKFFSFMEVMPVLTEIMAFSYWSYYLIIFGVGLYIYFSFESKEFEFYMFKVCVTFLICYCLFILIPVRGPHHAMANTDPTSLDGGLFQAIILFMQSKGSTVGAAFPSSHVAVAWISAFSLRHFKKRMYNMLIPLLLLLTISVFYLRYHYVLDAIFGYFLAIWLERRYIWLSLTVKSHIVENAVTVVSDKSIKLEEERSR